MAKQQESYPASFDIDYPGEMDRLTTFARILWSIPILILLAALTGSGGSDLMHHTSKGIAQNGGDVMAGLSAATAMMIIFRQRYPRWWFDFALELNRFSSRVGAYVFLLTDQYPSTVEKQSVHLDITYPEVERDLNRWLPLVKWLLAIPHYIVLAVLALAAFFATIIAWFAILFTGRYPQSLFDFVVGVGRWGVRVTAYTFMLTTDEYPPFSLKQ
jgi:hypothetical protein